jgi:RHS repeat-associated protein
MTILRTFHHPDHLGSSSWITDNTGRPIQHLHYLPFGEDWVDQRNSSWNTPYTFSGKEKDLETGYGYFGARYYDSGLSIWLSVDPMSDKYPSMSPYNYCANNPVILVDPDGREIYPTVNFMKSNYWTAHKYLLNNNQNYSNALDLFITSNNYNIYYSTAEMYGKGGNTSYEYYTNNGRTTHIESDESYNNADASSPLSIFHFYILIHEKGHTLESFVKNDVTKRNYGHDGFVMQLNLIMGMFNELNEDLKLNLSKSQIFELSIYGAESTDVYKNYIKELANSNKTDFETENANYVNRMHDLMSKEVKID